MVSLGVRPPHQYFERRGEATPPPGPDRLPRPRLCMAPGPPHKRRFSQGPDPILTGVLRMLPHRGRIDVVLVDIHSFQIRSFLQPQETPAFTTRGFRFRLDATPNMWYTGIRWQ